MAIKIDNDLLVELGLGSPPDAEKNGLLKHIYETLEMNGHAPGRPNVQRAAGRV